MAESSQSIEPQVVDSESDAGDSYEESAFSTASVTSSVYHYENEHGRTYHAYHAGKYVVPNDKQEQERMDLNYHAIRLTMGNRLYLAPIDPPTSVVDVGTGTGIWAMDVADEFPNAEVVGWDLSPIQPGAVPPNLQFEIFDAEEPWAVSNRYDLIHTRLMNFSFKGKWLEFYKESFAAMKPGGWVEAQEFALDMRSDDNSIGADNQMKKWVTLQNQAAEMGGFSLKPDTSTMIQNMTDAGFVKVAMKEYKMPLGPWPLDAGLREAGLFALVSFLEGMYGLSVRLWTRFLGWTPEELEIFLAGVKADLKKKAVHSYLPV